MASAAENIIVLGTYYDPLEAHLARTRLEAAGIACFLSNENLAVLNRMYSPAAGGVRLHVYERDAARATETLRAPALMYAERGGRAPADSLPTETTLVCRAAALSRCLARLPPGRRPATGGRPCGAGCGAMSYCRAPPTTASAAASIFR